MFQMKNKKFKKDFISNNLIEIQLEFDDDNETKHQIIKSLQNILMKNFKASMITIKSILRLLETNKIFFDC
jgi:hypothetical protein